jgi:hypothetical protein
MSQSFNPSTPGVMHQASVPGASELVLIDALEQRLKNYLAAMGPSKPIDGPQGALQQAQLWQTIKWVLTKERGEFTILYGKLLEIIAANRQGSFHERNAYRFFDQLKLSTPERRNFERMLNLMLTTCDPRTRALSMRQVDLRRVLEGFTDNAIHQRIVGFYEV